jgi:hypothetical protein
VLTAALPQALADVSESVIVPGRIGTETAAQERDNLSIEETGAALPVH